VSAIGVASKRVGAFKSARTERVTPVSRPARDNYSYFFGLLVALFLALVAGLLLWGWSFYSTPLAQRYLHPQYPLLKSAGPLGLLLGVVGTAMMVLSLLYVVSKRSKFLQGMATPARWLQLHIFLGFAGPVLVTLHTAGRIGGLVSVAFYSMWLMVLSGVIGRYIYAKLPRTIKGTEMTLKEMEAQLQGMAEALTTSPRGELLLPPVKALLGRTRRAQGGLLRATAQLLRDDLEMPLTAFRVWRIFGAEPGLSRRRRLEMTRLVLRQQRLLARLAVYGRTKQIFSYWHVFHRPFIVLTLVLSFLHICTALYLGYGFSW